MAKKMIPIYGEQKKGRIGFTIFLDLQTKRVYRSFHDEVNQSNLLTKYLFGFILIRGLSEIPLPALSVWLKILLLLAVASIGIVSGMKFYNKETSNYIELYPSQEMLEDYIHKGRAYFKKELIIAISVLSVFIIFALLFVVFHWTGWLLLSVITSFILGVLLRTLSIERWKLYKEGMDFFNKGIGQNKVDD